MARTTIDLDPTVLRELRSRGARERKTLGQIASELLAGALSNQAPPQASKLRWTSRDLGRPLVDLEDKDALLAVLNDLS